ncbi:hypothetical protein C9374_010850 [Naegleria lovaniensis]|uniref:Uncharacterized protein n=1 Tax=Naegleria lovaniensis TaxID=51637 RepID=A0AA88GAE1_NAELO|nr:uncharacterized protein C9374_010850 [Naegleria lovaniensis]KAG2374280.1 hypothetical protein C9374_010850 [Naegleria lovaniensis]
MDDELMNDENYDRHNLLRDFEYCVYSEAGPLIPYCSLTISQTIIQGLNCRLKFARNESNTEMNFKNTFFKEGNYCEKIEENLDELWKNRDALYFSDAVIFLFDSMKLKEIKSEINLDTLETVELLPCLRRVILQYPFSPIVLVLSDIYTANEFENQISRTLLNFPHVTGVYEYAQDRTVLEVACNSALYGLRSCAQLHVDLTQQRKTCELQ